MTSITSANVACGFHGGDPTVIRRTVELARDAGVAVGAHPSLPDLAGFGRREMDVTPAEVEDLVVYQVSAVRGIAAASGVRLQHVKAHGALYNMAARDIALATALARAVAAVDPSLVLLGLAGSKVLDAGRQAGLRVASEVFADRAYEGDGSLASRRKAGTVIHDPDVVVDRAVAMVRNRGVMSLAGTFLPLACDTMCVHGDTPGAADLARRLRSALEAAGIAVVSLGHAV
jgi:UPF0271 protein